MKHWTDIKPEDAVDLVLPHSDIIGPVNSNGTPCPWPWEPQQLVGVPMGQYLCSYCGEMEIAGVRHSDWSGEVDDG